MRFDVLFCPRRQRFRLHEIELRGITIGHLSGLQDSAEKAAVIRQHDRLNDIQVPFGLYIIVVTHPAATKRLIILMDDADGTGTEPFNRSFPLKLDQCIPKWPHEKRLIFFEIAVG